MQTVRRSFVLLVCFGLLAASPRVVIAQTTAAPATVASADNSAMGAPAVPSWLDNLDFFFGLDGSKQPQDLGINANMGIRLAANVGMPIVKAAGLGAQVGVAMNFSDAAVHVLDQIEGTSRRSQTFVTGGLFQQDASRLSWNISYDFLHESYFDTFVLGQLRGRAGYRVARVDEVGAWFTKSVKSANGIINDTPVQLDPISQFNVYLKHTWPTEARTLVWAGVASHHNIVLLLPDNSRDRDVVVYGAQLELPLSNRLSVTGSGNFLTPAATGTVDAYLGVTFYPGRRSLQAARSRFAPSATVANNPEFPVDLSR